MLMTFLYDDETFLERHNEAVMGCAAAIGDPWVGKGRPGLLVLAMMGRSFNFSLPRLSRLLMGVNVNVNRNTSLEKQTLDVINLIKVMRELSNNLAEQVYYHMSQLIFCLTFPSMLTLS